MEYLIYKTTHVASGKIYIGVHRTENRNDEYLGSGVAIRNAIKKYGKSAFSKEILFVLDSEEAMFAKERELVTEDFVARKDTYNLTVGGDYVPLRSATTRQLISEAAKRQWKDPEYRKRQTAVLQGLREDNSERMKERNSKQWDNPKFRETMQRTRRAYRPTDATKAKIGQALTGRPASANVKASMSQVGAKNKGSIWIKHTETHQCKKAQQHELTQYLAEGWTLGRIGWKQSTPQPSI